jgi:hypothetical protein
MVKASAKDLPAKAAGDSVSPIFGVTLDLNGHEVPISTDTVDPSKGFEFELTKPVTIGSPADFLTWIDETFGTTLKKTLDPNALPKAIADVVNKLLNVEIGVLRAHIKVPAKDSPDSPKFTIVFSATFPGEGLPLIPGSKLLMLKGGVAGATNEQAQA